MSGDHPQLRRSVGLVGLVLYGLGTIIGAGIYVLVGEIVFVAGMKAPIAFIVAGSLAAITGLSYAELSARYPEAGGAAVYLREAFDSEAVGKAAGLLTAAMAAVTAASLSRGGVGYLQPFVDVPAPLASGAIIALFTLIACVGIRESMATVTALSLLEVGGLILVILAGTNAMPEGTAGLAAMLPTTPADWKVIGTAAFLAFFAFIGFDSMVTMAEETTDVRRTLPVAILLAIALSTALYLSVMVVALLSVPVAALGTSGAPLLLVIERGMPSLPPALFAPIALMSALNGILIEILVASRLVYGIARRGWLPVWIGAVHAGRQTPLRATVLVGGIVFALAVSLPFEVLVATTSSLLLLLFAAVNLALWRLHRVQPRADLAIAAPAWAPPLGTASCLLLIGIAAL